MPNANIFSIKYWAQRSGCAITLCENSTHFDKIDGLIIPGVGRFDTAMNFINHNNLSECIKDFCSSLKPVLGICLGMHLLMRSSDEGTLNGLGILPGEIKSICDGPMKVPNIGWREIRNSSCLMGKFYFMHSFCLKYSDYNKEIFSNIELSNCNEDFIAGLTFNNITCCQYHPEKSYKLGDNLFQKFFIN